MQDILSDLKWRYAVKKFDSRRNLSTDQINRFKEVFNLTATSYGLQPIRLVILQNKELQQQLVPHSFDQKQVAQASHVLILCTENNVDADYISGYFDLVQKTRGTSTAILNPFKEMMVANFSNMSKAQINAWTKNQAYLAMGSLLTFCAIEKIDSCPMEGFDPKAYDKLLDLSEKGVSSVLVLPIGYRADDDAFATYKKVRKDVGSSVVDIG